MIVVEEFIRLTVQMHQTEAKLEKDLAPLRKRIANQEAKKKEAEKKIKEKKDIGRQEPQDFEEEDKIIKEVEDKISQLKTVEQEKRQSVDEDFKYLIEKVIKRAKNEPHIIGKAIGISENIAHQLKCHVCEDICSEDKPMMVFTGTDCTDDGSKKTCIECSEGIEVEVDEESLKKIKELKLIKQIIPRLEGELLISTRIGNK